MSRDEETQRVAPITTSNAVLVSPKDDAPDALWIDEKKKTKAKKPRPELNAASGNGG